MDDLFQEKAEGWDERPVPAQISAGVSAAILSTVALTDDLQVLDFGAGTGLLCSQLAPRVGRIVAVDISAAMLDKLRAKPELQDKVEVVCQDILETPLCRQVGLIVSAMAMHHVEDTTALVRAFAQHLEPGGRIALADLDSEDGSFHSSGTQGVYHLGFDRPSLRSLLRESGFRDIEFQTALEADKNGRRYAIFLVTATLA